MSCKDVELVSQIARQLYEWMQIFHELLPSATVKEAFVDGHAAVYVTAGVPKISGGAPPHRYLRLVSKLDEPTFAACLKEEATRWNALGRDEQLAAATKRATRWEREKILNMLAKKGFPVGGPN
jgi:hypothetical protein